MVCKYELFLEVLSGKRVLEEVVLVLEVDLVMVVIVGVVGFELMLVVVKVGKWVLLVNKELLVMFGVLFLDVVR